MIKCMKTDKRGEIKWQRTYALLKVHVPNGDLREQIEEILFTQCRTFLKEQQKTEIVSVDLLSKLYVANALALINWTLEHGMDDQAIHFASVLQNHVFKML